MDQKCLLRSIDSLDDPMAQNRGHVEFQLTLRRSGHLLDLQQSPSNLTTFPKHLDSHGCSWTAPSCHCTRLKLGRPLCWPPLA